MAKRSKDADEIYNARKRYWRSAERNLKRAEESQGLAADKYRRQAEQELKQAIATYDTSKKINFSKNIRNLAKSLNINLETEIQQSRGLTREERTRSITRSFNTLESNLNDDEYRKQQAARTVLSNPTIGSRIYGGLVDLWTGEDGATTWDDKEKRYKVDTNKINDIITEKFGVDDIADVLEILEERIGERLYSIEDETTDIYKIVKLMIQSYVAENFVIQ